MSLSVSQTCAFMWPPVCFCVPTPVHFYIPTPCALCSPLPPGTMGGLGCPLTATVLWFLSSAYIVSPGPKSQRFFLSFIISDSNFLCLWLLKALEFGTGSGITPIQGIITCNTWGWLIYATIRFLAWLSSTTLSVCVCVCVHMFVCLCVCVFSVFD